MSSIAEKFPKEQERVRGILKLYEEIPTGGFGAASIRQVLRRAEKVSAVGDVVGMIRSY